MLGRVASSGSTELDGRRASQLLSLRQEVLLSEARYEGLAFAHTESAHPRSCIYLDAQAFALIHGRWARARILAHIESSSSRAFTFCSRLLAYAELHIVRRDAPPASFVIDHLRNGPPRLGLCESPRVSRVRLRRVRLEPLVVKRSSHGIEVVNLQAQPLQDRYRIAFHFGPEIRQGCHRVGRLRGARRSTARSSAAAPLLPSAARRGNRARSPSPESSTSGQGIVAERRPQRAADRCTGGSRRAVEHDDKQGRTRSGTPGPAVEGDATASPRPRPGPNLGGCSTLAALDWEALWQQAIRRP